MHSCEYQTRLSQGGCVPLAQDVRRIYTGKTAKVYLAYHTASSSTRIVKIYEKELMNSVDLMKAWRVLLLAFEAVYGILILRSP